MSTLTKSTGEAITAADINTLLTDVDSDDSGTEFGTIAYVPFNANLSTPTAGANQIYRDNTGDMNYNALTGKQHEFKINGTNEYVMHATEFEISSGNKIQFLGNDGIVDSNGNEVIMVEAVGSAVNYLNVKNAATANPIVIECLGTADKGFTFAAADDEEILKLTPVASAVNELEIVSAASGNRPIIRAGGTDEVGMILANYDGTNTEEILILEAVATAVNEITIKSAATTDKPSIMATGEGDLGMILSNHDGTTEEEILILAATATAVNEITITSAAASGSPSIAATGDDTNIDLTLTPKGTGVVLLSGGLDVAGTKIDLDADNDTSITADTDDQIDFEINGTDTFIFTTTHLQLIDNIYHSYGTGDDYRIGYDATNTRLYIWTNDSDGGGSDVDIIRVPDGQTTIDGNTTFDDNAFDYVCHECGHHQLDPGDCPNGHGRLAWQDDTELALQAASVIGQPMKRGTFDVAVADKLAKIGLLKRYEDGQYFIPLQTAHLFSFSAIAQLGKRVKELEQQLAAV